MHSYNVLNRYNHKTRVGNWYEESELNDFNFKDHLYNKDHNLNETLKTKTKIGFSSKPKQLTEYGDGLIRFGDLISLGSERTHGVLSFNINEPILGEETYAVTTSKNLSPSLRNVFSFLLVGNAKDNILVFGQQFRLCTEAGDKKVLNFKFSCICRVWQPHPCVVPNSVDFRKCPSPVTSTRALFGPSSTSTPNSALKGKESK
jgi:hypothetical protein